MTQDEPQPRMIMLRSGWAAAMRHTAAGKRALLSIYLPGDIIGADCIFYARRPDEVTSLSAVNYGVIERDDLRRLVQNREVCVALMHFLAADRRRADASAVGLARESAIERMAALIFRLHRRLQHKQIVSGTSFHLPLTQQDMGDHLGLTVVHVNRVLRALRESGIVVVHDRTVVISDPSRLRRLASASAPEGGVPQPSVPHVAGGVEVQ
jgi:CRP-like cAMP-binding protein